MASILDQATAAWMAQHPFWLPEVQRPAQPTNVLEIPSQDPTDPYQLADPRTGEPVAQYDPFVSRWNPFTRRPTEPQYNQPVTPVVGGARPDPGDPASIFYGDPRYDRPRPLGRPLNQLVNVLSKPWEWLGEGATSALGPKYGPLAGTALGLAAPWTIGPALEAVLGGRTVPPPDLPPGIGGGGPPPMLPTRPTAPLPGGRLADVLGNVQAARGAAGQSAIEQFGAVAPGTRPFTQPEIEAATTEPTVPPLPVSPGRFHGSQRGPINVLTRPDLASDPRNIIGPATFTTNDLFEAEGAATTEMGIQTTRTQPGGTRRPVYRVDEVRPGLDFFRINDFPLSTQQLDKVAANLPETIPDPRFPREAGQKVAVRKRFLRELHGTAKSKGIREGAAQFRAIDLLGHYFNPRALPEERAMRTLVQSSLRKVLEDEGYAGIEYEHPAAVPGMAGNVDHIKAYFHPERDIHMTPLPEHEWSLQFVRDVPVPGHPGSFGARLVPQRIGPPEVRPLRPGESPWR